MLRTPHVGGHRRRHAVRRALCAAAVGSLVLTAGTAGAQPRAASLTHLDVGVPGDSLGFAPWFLAKQDGSFRLNGLDVKFVYMSGDAIPTSLVSGAIQATPLTETVMQARFAGYAVKNVAVLLTRPVYRIVAWSSIRSLKDLRGQTVVAGPPKVLPTLVLNYFLERDGLKPDRDVKILYVGAITARRTLMLAARADAIIDSTKGALQMMHAAPQLRPLLGESDMPELLADGVGVSEELLAATPGVITRVVRALAQSTDNLRKRPDRAAALLAAYLKMPNDGKTLVAALNAALAERLTPSRRLYEAEARFASAASGLDVSAAQVMGAWDTGIAETVDEEMSRPAIARKP
jgi:NitT/TauT family transport system substrate-binding protein